MKKLFSITLFILILSLAFSISYIPISVLKANGFSVLPGATENSAYIVANAIYKVDTSKGNIYENLSQPLNFKPIYAGGDIYIPVTFLEKYFPQYIYHSFEKVYIIDKKDNVLKYLEKSKFLFSSTSNNFHVEGTNAWIYSKGSNTYNLYLYPISESDFGVVKSKLSSVSGISIEKLSYDNYLASFSLVFSNKIEYSGTKTNMTVNLITYNEKNGVKIKNYTFKDSKTKITVITIDSREYNVLLKPTVSKSGIGTWESLQDASRRINAYIVVAANYFDPATNTPLGFLYNNGEILSEPFKTRPIFAQLGSGRFKLINYENIYSLDCLLNMGGVLFTANTVNKPYKGQVAVFTDNYRKTIPVPKNAIVFEAKDSRLIKKGYINHVDPNSTLIIIPTKYNTYINKIKIPSPFSFYVDTYPETGIRSAISAGPTLLIDGEIYRDFANEMFSSSPIITTKAPRTAIGYDQYGNLMIIATTTPGLTIKQFQIFLKKIGMDTAMGLDGGKSVTLIVDGKVYNGFHDVKLPVFLGISLVQKTDSNN